MLCNGNLSTQTRERNREARILCLSREHVVFGVCPPQRGDILTLLVTVNWKQTHRMLWLNLHLTWRTSVSLTFTLLSQDSVCANLLAVI